MLLGFRIAFFKVTESESLAVTFTAWHFKSEYFSALDFYRSIFIIKSKYSIYIMNCYSNPLFYFQVRKKLLKMKVSPVPGLENPLRLLICDIDYCPWGFPTRTQTDIHRHWIATAIEPCLQFEVLLLQGGCFLGILGLSITVHGVSQLKPELPFTGTA